MRTILELSHTEARQYFLKQERYCNIDLPKYFIFQSLLNAISSKINGKNIHLIKCDKAKKCFDINHTIFNNKDGNFSWRPLQLINPAIYVFLVHKITEKTNWKLIIDRFKLFQKNTKIECCGLPILPEKGKKNDKASTVMNWWETIEQQSLELSLDFDYFLNTDITDCYGSIYTHTISWALRDKEIAKKKRRDEHIGNCIDETIQSMQNGQTNGIPQGSVLMDFIAEMVLGYADFMLSKKIEDEKIEDYKILRYRDDYRIFTNTQEDASKIAKFLTEILIDLNLRLNSSKTFISKDIIQNAIKPDKIFLLGSKQNEKNLQKSLLLIHALAKKYPNSGSITRMLSTIQKRISRKLQVNKKYIKVLISIVVDIAYKNPKTYPITVAILSKLLSRLDDNKTIVNIIDSIEKKFKKIPNVGYLQIWLQRMTLKINEKRKYDEKLCEKIIDDSAEVWNISWLNNDIKTIFSQNSIINRDYIQNMDPIIKPNEVQLFNDPYLY